MQTLKADEDISTLEEESHWWSGISFTPGIGARHLGLDITRKTDGLSGNISQDAAAKLYFSFSISSPEYTFDDSNFGISLRTYSSFVTLDRQFYNYEMLNPATGENNAGDRIDVGTKISGHYSYIVPMLHYKLATPGLGSFKVAAGMGLWSAKLSGNIALTENDKPYSGTPKSDINLETNDQLAYLVLLSYTSKSNFIFEMAIGGPEFEDSDYKYKVEEVSLIIGKEFVL